MDRLDQMLERVNPTPLSREETLHRYQVQRAALIQKMITGAEKVYPGIAQLLVSIDERIEKLERSRR